MIRIGLYSEDCKLQPLFASALGKEFQILIESNEDGIDRMLSVEAAMLSSSTWTPTTLRCRNESLAAGASPLLKLPQW